MAFIAHIPIYYQSTFKETTGRLFTKIRMGAKQNTFHAHPFLVHQFILVLVFISVRIIALPSPGISTHLLDAILCFPAKLSLCLGGIGIAGCNTEDVKTAIVAQDTKALSKLPGVGAKMAGRLALELKDKVSLFSSIDSDTVSPGVSDKNTDNTLISEAVSILTALGYSSSEALRAIRSVDISDDDTAESLVPKALRVL